MQAASRDALASCLEQLDVIAGADETVTDRVRRFVRNAIPGGSDATLPTATSYEDLSHVADDLLGVATVLVREASLRRALSDPSRSEGDRVQLAEAVFGSHLAPPSLALIRAMVSARWSRSGDLVDAAELLGVEALLIAAEREDVLADVEDELFRFERIVEGHPSLGAVLGDESAEDRRRVAVVDELLDNKAKPVTVRLAKVAVTGLGGRGFESSLDRLIELAAARRNRSVVRVRVAAPIDEEQERGLAAALARGYHREMSLQVEVDESLVGGAIVRVGSDLYDGSIARRLAEARRHLTNP